MRSRWPTFHGLVPVELSFCLSAFLSVCLPVCLPACLSFSLSVSLRGGMREGRRKGGSREEVEVYKREWDGGRMREREEKSGQESKRGRESGRVMEGTVIA